MQLLLTGLQMYQFINTLKRVKKIFELLKRIAIQISREECYKQNKLNGGATRLSLIESDDLGAHATQKQALPWICVGFSTYENFSHSFI